MLVPDQQTVRRAVGSPAVQRFCPDEQALAVQLVKAARVQTGVNELVAPVGIELVRESRHPRTRQQVPFCRPIENT